MNSEIAAKIINEATYEELYILMRYLYRVGDPIVDDHEFDNYELLMKEKFLNLEEYYNRTYDDDPIPFSLLEKYALLEHQKIDGDTRNGLKQSLEEDKSMSIKAIRGYTETWTFFKQMRDLEKDVVVSLKMDGANAKNLYKDNSFVLSLSRGRDTNNSFDYTENMSLIIPQTFYCNKEEIKITGECYVDKNKLSYLRNKYDADKYVSSKSSAISMLRVRHEIEDYQYLHLRVFRADGVADTLTETFKILEEAGFEVVPHKWIAWSEIPDNYEEFKGWCKSEIFDAMYELGEGLPSDGVVVEVNDLAWDGQIENQYNSRQIALKFEYWGFDVYCAEITSIIIEQRRVFKSVKVGIKPLVTRGDSTAKVINGFNPRILIENNLCVGSKVYFERNSDAVNIVLHGNKLKMKLENPEDSEVF